MKNGYIFWDTIWLPKGLGDLDLSRNKINNKLN